MKGLPLALVFLFVCGAPAQDSSALGERAREYLAELIRRDTTNPPGNETSVAEYLKQVADAHGIPAEVIGGEPARMNFVARLRGSGEERPLLLMAHSDVVAAEREQWTADPFGAEVRDGFLYGRGAQDTKNLLAAEMAVLVELKRRGIKLRRDVIVLAEADEEAGSTGMQWLIANAWDKIDADFAINEAGLAQDTPEGVRLFQIQTSEKIPTRVVLTAKGTAGHGSLPRPDNPVVRLARALVRLAEADQPVRLDTTTRRYLSEVSKLGAYRWLAPLLPQLESPLAANGAAAAVRRRDPELDAMLRTTVSPTLLRGGLKINVIPTTAEAQVDVRRLPEETRAEVIARLRRIVNDSAVEVAPAGGQEMPATEPSSLTTALYRAMEDVFRQAHPKAVVVPLLSRGATDGSFLRRKGMAVYGAPLFMKEAGDSRVHGNDERIAVADLRAGAELLWNIVLRVAAAK